MKALDISNVIEEKGGFSVEVTEALKMAGLAEDDPMFGFYVEVDLDDNGGDPDGSPLLPEDRVFLGFEALKAVLEPFGVEELEVEQVYADSTYAVIRDALRVACDVRWVGYSKDNALYIEIE